MRTKGSGQSALLLLDVIDILNSLKIPYAIVGALAVSYYGVVRASIDADAVISLIPQNKEIKRLTEALKKARLRVSLNRGDIDDPIAAVINVKDSLKNRVDLIMGIRGMREDVYLRSVHSKLEGVAIRVVGLEDLIVMKIYAGSPLDLYDVNGILEVSGKKINVTLLRELVSRYGKKDRQKLEILLKEFKL